MSDVVKLTANVELRERANRTSLGRRCPQGGMLATLQGTDGADCWEHESYACANLADKSSLLPIVEPSSRCTLIVALLHWQAVTVVPGTLDPPCGRIKLETGA